MISYVIAMNFISWTLAIWALMGFGFIKSCEATLKSEDAKDHIKMGASIAVEDYNSRSPLGRLALVTYYGARCVAILFDKNTYKKDDVE